MKAVQVDPEAPSIWFSQGSMRAARDDLSVRSSAASAPAEEAVSEAAPLGHTADADGGEAGGTEGSLSAESPFFLASGSGRGGTGLARAVVESEGEEEVRAERGENGEAELQQEAEEEEPPPAASEHDIPPADAAAAAAVAEVAAVAAAAAAAGSPRALGAASAAGSGAASSRPALEQQLTLRFPTVITPSGGPGGVVPSLGALVCRRPLLQPAGGRHPGRGMRWRHTCLPAPCSTRGRIPRAAARRSPCRHLRR